MCHRVGDASGQEIVIIRSQKVILRMNNSYNICICICMCL